MNKTSVFAMAFALTFCFSGYADDTQEAPVERAVDAADVPAPAPVDAVVQAEAEPGFTGDAAKIKAQLEKLFVASKQVNAKDAQRNPAREQIEGSLDWERVAKDCLGNAEWQKNSPANRNSYRELLKEVVVKTAFTRLDKFWDGATYKFSKIDIKGTEAQATATFKVKGEGFTVDYYLHRKGKDWAIYDVAFEDIRYSENIREQIKAFLKEKPFTQLLAKLRKKRDELVEGANGTKNKGKKSTASG